MKDKTKEKSAKTEGKPEKSDKKEDKKKKAERKEAKARKKAEKEQKKKRKEASEQKTAERIAAQEIIIKETKTKTAKSEERIPRPRPAAKKEPKARKTLDQTKNLVEYVEIFRALGDESRIQILRLLEEKEYCAAELLERVPIVQSTLSHHLKILCESGLVNCRKQGRWAYYSLNPAVFMEVAACLNREA